MLPSSSSRNGSRPGNAVAISWLALAIIFSGAGGTPAQSQSAGYDHKGTARQALEKHIRPGYARFAVKAAALNATMGEACKRRGARDIDGIRAAFRGALSAWSQVEHLRFGPAVANNRYERILFFPDRQKIGKRQVGKILAKRDPKVLTLAGLQKKSVAVQGFTALEILLYGKRSGDLLKDSEVGRFNCGYAQSIAANLAGIAKEISAAWGKGGSFTQIWLNPGPQNALYKSARGSTFELLKAYRFGLNNARELKLLWPLGKKRAGLGGPFRPRAPAPLALSGLSITAMIGNITGVLDLFENGGFAQRLAENEPETVELVKSELRSAGKIGSGIEALGAKAYTDKAGVAALDEMRVPLKTALLAGGETLTMSTGMVLGFTDDDGD